MRSRISSICSFSLIEVVIAIGIFAAGVAVILGLLPSLTRQAATSADTMTALRLPDLVRVELQRVAMAGGFDSLASQIKPMATPLPATLSLAASHDATRVQSLLYQVPSVADQVTQADQFFLVEVWSFSPSSSLLFNSGDSVLVLHVRVSWPYFIPGSSTPTLFSDREQVTFNLALNR